MTTFKIHTLETAPDESKPLLEAVGKKYGSIPNLMAVFAESPAALRGYVELGQVFEDSSAFDATERQIVLLATSFENDCGYCMAAHTAIANLQKVPADVVENLREGTPIADPKLEALRSFAGSVVEKRGWVSDDEVQSFLGAGYTLRHVLEVIVGVSFKTLSNFTNHVAETPVDPSFAPFTWKRPVSAS